MNRTWFVRLYLVSGIAMLLMGSSLQLSLLGLRAGIEDFSIVATGLFMSAYHGGYLFGSTYAFPTSPTARNGAELLVDAAVFSGQP